MTLVQSVSLRVLVLASLFIISLSAQTVAPVVDSGAPATRLTAEGGGLPGGARVPRLLRFSGAVPASGAAAAGDVCAVTFSLYAEQSGGDPLWSETQNVALDEQGRYSVLLGAASEGGMPVELFASGAARWLETHAKDSDAGNRALLVSVPYALKAEEAERLSSDGFAALSEQVKASVREQMETALAQTANKNVQTAVRPIDVRSNVTGSGTAGVATVFSDTSTVDVVTVTQSGTGRALTATSTTANAIRATSAGTGSAGAAIYGINSAASGTTVGVRGDSASTTATAVGVQGVASGATGATIGVRGSTSSSTGFGVRGDANNTSAGTGVYGVSLATGGNSVGVLGEATGLNGVGVQAKSNTNAKLFQGIKGGLPQFTVDANGNITAAGSLTLGVGGVINASSLNVPSAAFTSGSAGQTLAATNTSLGAALLATNTGSGAAISATGATATSTAIVANSNNGAKLFSGMDGATEVFSVYPGSSSFIVGATQSNPGDPLPDFCQSAPCPTALLGVETNPIGYSSGVLGFNASVGGGSGVAGVATSTTGLNVGVTGQSYGDQGTGTVGVAFSPTGATLGVYGLATSNQGTGVLGYVSSTTGVTLGVNGETASNQGIGVFGGASSTTGVTVGVLGRSDSVNGIGVSGYASTTSNIAYGVLGTSDSPSGVAGVFNNTAGGFILVGQDNGVDVLSVTGNGTVFATAFVGNGSGLTGLTGAQTGNVNTFTANQFFTADLDIAATSSASVGVITSGGVPFIHDFGNVNTFVGKFAGNFTMTGIYNTVVGYAALPDNSTGAENTAVGDTALNSNTTGNLNTAIGAESFLWNTTGSGNTAIGASAGTFSPSPTGDATGSNNTFIGFSAGPATSTEVDNATAIGSSAKVGCSNCMVLGDGTVNVGIGTQTPAAALDVVGNGNFSGTVTAASFIGSTSSPNVLALPFTSNATTGVLTINGVPFLHGYGLGDTFVGPSAGNFVTTGGNNTGVGDSALVNNTAGGINTAVGSSALNQNTAGTQNTAIGGSALSQNVDGVANTAVGSFALNFNISGGNNVAVGSNSLYFNTADFNVAVGSTALQSNTTGDHNTAVGNSALDVNTSGASNAAFGADALFANTNGVSNTALGAAALTSNTTGFQNTAVGTWAGLTLAQGNANTTGTNNTFLGAFSGPGTATQLTDATAIGFNALVSCSNCMVLGDGTVSVGIGTQSPTATLDVAGSGRFTGPVTPGASDANVTPIAKHFSARGVLISFSGLSAGTCTDQLGNSVPGAQFGDSVALGTTALSTNIGFMLTGYVDGAGTVAIRACRIGGGSGGSLSGTVNIDVWE